MDIRRIVTILRRIACLILILVFFICFFKEKTEQTKITYSQTGTTTDNWYLNGSRIETFPTVIQGKKDFLYEIVGVFPQDINPDCCFTLKSTYSSVKIFCDNELICDYSSSKHFVWSKISGNIRVICPVLKEYAGHKLTIQIVPFYNQGFSIEKIVFDSYGNIMLRILLDNIARLVMIVIMLTIFVLSLGINIFGAVKNSNLNRKTTNYFCLFVFVVSMWLICSSDLPQFVVDQNGAVSILSYLLLTTTSPLFCGFCEQIFVSGKKILRAIQGIGWITCLINLFGLLSGLYDPPQILILTHINLALAMGVIIFISLKEFNRNIETKAIAIANVVLISFSVAALISFYMYPTSGYDGIIIGNGLVIFIIILLCILLYHQIVFAEQRKYLDTYRELAFADMLTGMGNRKAFEDKLHDLNDNSPLGTKVTFIMFDLNFLKKTNDEYGHKAGDELLICAASVISSVFDNLGSTFRIGGDEFSALLTDSKIPENELVNRFNAAVKKYNLEHNTNLSVAIGMSTGVVDRRPEMFKEISIAADTAMYKDKERKHIEELPVKWMD